MLLSQALFGVCYSKAGSESFDFSLKIADNSVIVTEFAVTESDSGFYRDQLRARIVKGSFRRFGARYTRDSGTEPSPGNREGRGARDLCQLITCLSESTRLASSGVQSWQRSA
jgi:hypothetical protein